MSGRGLAPACFLALLMPGCPKRQTVTRVVYAPPPPSAAAATAGAPSGELVIVEQPPPEPVAEPAAPEETAPTTNPAPKRHRPSEGAAPAAPPALEEPAEVPALEPRVSPAEQNQLRKQIISLQQQIRQRIAAIEHTTPATVDRKTLDEALGFLKRSDDAVQKGNLRLALNLAQKALLLVGGGG